MARAEITELLRGFAEGDAHAQERLMTALYPELHRIASRYMRRESPGHTLQTTALVNEVYLRIRNQGDVNWENRAHFLAIAAQLMRRILVDCARRRNARRRGKGYERIELNEELLVGSTGPVEILKLEEILQRLEEADRRACQVTELRFFGGLSMDETALVLKVSVRTVKRDWRFAKAWLRAELTR